MDTQLVQYYQLCAIKPTEQRGAPLLNALQPEGVEFVFPNVTREAYYNRVDGVLRLKETIIGAGERRRRKATGARQNIIVL